MAEVLGHLERLSDDRLVFAGYRAEKPDLTYLGFRNEHGDVTRIALSPDATDALVRALTAPAYEPEPFPPDLEKVWRVVKQPPLPNPPRPPGARAMTAPYACPHCKADLTGAEIPNEYRHWYGDATHWSLAMAKYDRDRDSVVSWTCPDCSYTWSRENPQ